MNQQGIVAMANAMGRLLQGLSIGRAQEVIEQILDRSDETVLYIPDQGVDCKGWESCRQALLELNRRCYGQVELTHSSAYRQCEDGTVMGHWNTYTYQLYQDGGGHHILYSYWRITARFVCVEGEWKLRELSKLMLLHVNPWEYDPADEPGLLDSPETGFYIPQGEVDAQDYVELRNLAGTVAHNGVYRCRNEFALEGDVELYLPDVMDKPAVGRSQVMAQLDRLEQMEVENLNMYLNFTTMCTPVIVARGDWGEATFLGNVINVRGPAMGYQEKPYRMQYRLAVIHMTYRREGGVWKIASLRSTLLCKINDVPYMNFHHDGSDGYPGRVEWMSKTPNRNLAPRWEGRKDCAQDIFEIESILPQWTERLKRRDLPDFPDLFMKNSQHDLVIQLSRSFYGYDTVCKHCNTLINGMLEGHETMWHNPQFHTGCSPVIQISNDGLSAQAWFIDKCWGNIGAAVFYDKDVKERKYYLGMGTYCHKFVKENGKWRLWHFGWTPTFGWSEQDPYRYTYDYTYGETGGWSQWAAQGGEKPWPLPFEPFRY